MNIVMRAGDDSVALDAPSQWIGGYPLEPLTSAALSNPVLDPPIAKDVWRPWFAIYPVCARVILLDDPDLPPIMTPEDDSSTSWQWLRVVDRIYESGRWQYAIRGRRMTETEWLEDRAAP